MLHNRRKNKRGIAGFYAVNQGYIILCGV